MKLSLFSLFLLVSVSAFAQDEQKDTLPIDPQTNTVTFQEVVKADSVLKDDLYTRAREWFSTSFKDAKAVLDMDDKAAGKLIGKGTTSGTFAVAFSKFPFTLHFTISITVKDGRYRYEIGEFTTNDDQAQYDSKLTLEELVTNLKYKKDNGEYRPRYRGYIETTLKTGRMLAETLKTAMAAKAKGLKAKDDF